MFSLACGRGAGGTGATATTVVTGAAAVMLQVAGVLAESGAWSPQQPVRL